jgi:hypothetical protein
MTQQLTRATLRLETKFSPFDERVGLGAGGRIEGYASVFDASPTSPATWSRREPFPHRSRMARGG